MVTIPTGSLVGLGLLCLLVGVLIGRSGRFMSALARRHESVHASGGAGGDASVAARTGDQHVSVVVAAQAQPKSYPLPDQLDPSQTVALVEYLAQGDRVLSVDAAAALDLLAPDWRNVVGSGTASVLHPDGSVELLGPLSIEAAR